MTLRPGWTRRPPTYPLENQNSVYTCTDLVRVEVPPRPSAIQYRPRRSLLAHARVSGASFSRGLSILESGAWGARTFALPRSVEQVGEGAF